MNKIRKEDLDILGGIVNLVGMHIKDYAQKTSSDSVRTLFNENSLNIQKTLKNAMLTAEDEAMAIIPNDGSFLPATPENDLNNPGNLNPPNAPETRTTSSINPSPLSISNEPQMHPNQMEFDFKDHRLDGIGSVRDVLTHFNDRLDKIENDIKLILTLLQKKE